MAIRKYFTFNGESSKDFGVYLTGNNTYNGTTKRQSKQTVAGRNGDVIISEDSYENQDYPYTIGIFANTEAELDEKIEKFRSWLLSSYGYCRLEDDYHPNEYRMAQFAGDISLSITNLLHAEGEISFDCKPQRFLKSGEKTIEFTENGEIENPTRFGSSPLIQIWGTGTLSIGIGHIKIDDSYSEDSILVDCDRYNSYTVLGVNANKYVTVDFNYFDHYYPELGAGHSHVILGSGITKVAITPRWWTL